MKHVFSMNKQLYNKRKGKIVSEKTNRFVKQIK